MMKAPWQAVRRTLAACCLCATASAQPLGPLHFVMEPLPPFVVDDKGKPSGPYYEAVALACTQLKLSCKFEILPWRRAYVLAEKGLVDGIFVLARNAERERDFYFSDPLIQSAYAVFTRQSSTLRYSQPNHLDNWTVAAYGPSGTSLVAEELAKLAAHMRVEIEVDNQSVLRKLAAGRYGERGAAVLNRDVGNYLIAIDGIGGLRVAGEIKRIDYAIGLSRKRLSAAQAEQFNAALRELQRHGKIKAIADKYGLRPAQ